MVESHIPVLLCETVDALAVKAGGHYVDGTFGRGGHSREIVRRGGEVLGIDRDESALVAAHELNVVKGCHGDLRQIAEAHGWKEVDGILLDLGVSSPQLDEAGRGFSFLREGPLDMRMDRSRGITAAEIINEASVARLEEIFRTLGEERQSRRLAQAIVSARERGRRFETTTSLAAFVEETIGRHGAHHPATRVFQALRMEVNDELGELARALAGGIALLKPGGRFAIITFESLSDRMVKRFFAAHAGREVSLQQGGSEWVGEEPRAIQVFKKAITASADEMAANPRARSAKLRALERK